MADRRKKIPLEKFFPNGFDKTNPDDMIKLTVLIQEKAAKNPEFEGYSVFRQPVRDHRADGYGFR